MGETNIAELDVLILKHRARLRELEPEAIKELDKMADAFSNNYRGKVLMCLALALGVRRMCAIAPGIEESDFVRWAMRGAALWVESGEPLTAKRRKIE